MSFLDSLLVNDANRIIGSLIDYVYVNDESLQKLSIDKTEIVFIF